MKRFTAMIRGAALVIMAAASAGAAEDLFKLRVKAAHPARYYLDDASGKAWTPHGAIVYVRRQEQHFVTANGFEVDLPAGTYTLIAERGPEHLPFKSTVEGRPGEVKEVSVALKRWTDMNRLGWYSGDLHNHRPARDMPILLLAEDLNLAPAILDWVWENQQRSIAPQTTDAVESVDPTHVYSVLDKEVERLRNGPGAINLFGLRSPVPFDGYLLYPPNDVFARQAHAQGAWVDAEKITWRDIAALVALGHIDFAGIVHNHFNRHGVLTETDQWGMIPKSQPLFNTPAGMPLWAMEVYYRFLNCGFRLPVSAGSASGVMASPPGYNRVYVKLDRPFSYRSWFESLKQGRSFGTNGPMLFLTVEGHPPGSVLRLPEKGQVRVQAEARSQRPMDRLESIFKGKTVRTIRGEGTLSLDFTLEAGESGWIAARAFERMDRTPRFAHTSPIYVEAPGLSRIVREDARFFIEWIDREIAFYKALPDFREPAHRNAMLALFTSARKVYARLAAEP